MSLGHGRTPINKGLPYIFERVAWRRIGEFSPGWGTGAAWPDGGTRRVAMPIRGALYGSGSADSSNG
jgi:hypothetical protein